MLNVVIQGGLITQLPIVADKLLGD